jgi:P4 family phage/plasmid primase-like protien
MIASTLFAAGYSDLVSVVPPDAPIAPSSRIDPTQLGKCPGLLGKEGWYGYNFLAEEVDKKVAVRWDRWGSNIGLRGRNFPGLDIDSEDEVLTQVVMHFARQHLGDAPVRTSRHPRRLMVYRTMAPFARMGLVVARGGKHHLIEWLGDGRQYLVHGRHPSGSDYGWEGSPLWHHAPDSLTLITGEQASAFLDTLASALQAQGLEVERVGGGAQKKEAPPQDHLRAPSIDQVRELVARIPNPASNGWDEHVEMGYAIKAAAGEEHEDEGLEIWQEWNARWERDATDEAMNASSWERFHPPFRVGWSWLQEQAEHLSDYSSAQDDFQADPNAGPPPIDPVPLTVSSSPVSYSDEWMVDCVLPHLQNQIRYIPGPGGQAGVWYYWDRYRWSPDGRMECETEVRAMMRRLAQRLQELAAQAPSKAEGKPLHQAAKRAQSNEGISAVLRLLRAKVACRETDFDRDPMVLNTPGGVIDLTDGTISPVVEGALFARATAYAPAPGKMPLFQRFLHDLTGGDRDFERFLQKLAGYTLTGDVSEKILGYAWGSNSDTGKSTYIRVLDVLLGDYSDTVDVSAFISGHKGDRIPADLARLPGVRLVTATEPAAGHAWDERRIKAITGGDEISARFLYGQWFTYQPQFKILIVGNHEPEIRHVDDAMLRRILILPFNKKVPREKQIENLATRMVEEEGPQILHWMVEGCLAWRKEGLAPPEVVTARTKQYADEQDTLGAFVAECCEAGPTYEIDRQTLYNYWAAYCRERDEDPGGAKSFRGLFLPWAEKLNLKESQIETASGQRRRGYLGLRLRLRTMTGAEGDFAA